MASPNDIDRVWSIVESIEICMLATASGGSLRARPMGAHAEREANCIWFLTDARGHKDEELRVDPRACLAFAEPRDNTYLSLSGKAETVHDQERIKALWNGAAEIFWPDGPADPNIRLIRFHPERAEYWDGASSTLVLGFEMIKSQLTGEQPDLGDNRKVSMS